MESDVTEEPAKTINLRSNCLVNEVNPCSLFKFSPKIWFHNKQVLYVTYSFFRLKPLTTRMLWKKFRRSSRRPSLNTPKWKRLPHTPDYNVTPIWIYPRQIGWAAQPKPTVCSRHRFIIQDFQVFEWLTCSQTALVKSMSFLMRRTSKNC